MYRKMDKLTNKRQNTISDPLAFLPKGGQKVRFTGGGGGGGDWVN